MIKIKEVGALAGLSLKTLFVATLGILIFGVYVGVLIYGENSLTVLSELKQKKHNLFQEGNALKSENQVLQKEYFELQQLEPNES